MDHQCQLHSEFAKRIDERMAAHMETHEAERGMVCNKLDKLESKTDKLTARINYMFGGAMLLGFVIQIVFMVLSSLKK
jgi:hypothetical protein